MYKIMYRLITDEKNIFTFWGEKDKCHHYQPYEYTTEEEAKEAGKELIRKIGAYDVRVVADEDYYLKVIMGERPEPVKETFEVLIAGSVNIAIEPDCFENVEKGSTIEALLSFTNRVNQFHLLIDGESYDEGIPEWIKYTQIDDYHAKLTLENIDSNHLVVIIEDDGSVEPEHIKALKEIFFQAGDDLAITYDKDILDLEFNIVNGELIINNNVINSTFKKNERGELEVEIDE